MTSESNKAINVFSTPTFSSCLSPFACPFTISNPLNRHGSLNPVLVSSSSSSSSSCSFCLDHPFPYQSMGGQGNHGYYANHSDATSDTTSDTTFPCVDNLDFEHNSCFAYYPLEEPPVHTHFTLPPLQSSQTGSSSSLGSVSQSGLKVTAVDQQGREIPHNKDQIRSAGSLSCNNLLEQGTIVEGSKLLSETSSVLHGKGSVAVGKDNQIKPEDKETIHTESGIFEMANTKVNFLNECMTQRFSVSSDLSFPPRPQDTQSQLSFSAPLMTWIHSGSNIITNERCFPHLDSCGAETLVSCAPEHFSYSAQIFNSSSASSNPAIVSPVPLENVASGDTSAVSNRDYYFGFLLPSMINADMVQNPVDNVACNDQVITEKGEKRKILEPGNNGTKNPSIVEKSKLQIACFNVPEDLTLEQHGAKAGITDDKSSTNHDDSDIDSPCWKGAQAYKSPLRDSVPVDSDDSEGQSPARVPVPLKSEHSKNEKVACNSLNPLAPKFIPGNSKHKVDYHQKECHADSSSSFHKIAALSVTSSSGEHKLIDSVKAGTCPSERIKDVGIKCSNHACDSRKEYGVPYTSFRSSAVNSSCGFQPYLREEYVTSENQLMRGTSVTDSKEGNLDAIHKGLDSVEDIAHNGPNASISFLTSETGLNSHSIGVGVFSDFTERLEEPSRSRPPNINVKLMMNTIQYLLELLLENSSFDLGSMSKHECDKLLNIIYNLYIIRNKAGQMSVRPESSDACALYGQTQPSEDLTPKQHGAKAVIPDDKSSTNHGDSDVDSPCWKGALAYKCALRDSVPVNSEDSEGQSPSRVSVPLKSEHSKNEKVACNSLNPLAPEFIPGNSKQKVDYHQKECHGDSSSSFHKIAALAVTSSSGEHKLIDSVKAGTCPSEGINDVGIQCSNDACDSRKDRGVPYTSFRNSAVNSSCSFQPYLGEEYVTSENQLVRGSRVAGSMEGILDVIHNGSDSVEEMALSEPIPSISFLASEIGSNSRSIGVHVFSDFTERLQEPSRSRAPKIDVKSMINTIQYLLELLLQNSSFNLCSLNEHEHDELQNIINNFYVIGNKAGQMSVRPESSDPCTFNGQIQPVEDLTLEQHGAKAGIPDDKSSTNHDDSDIDSPCWKGALAYKCPLTDSVPVNSEDSKGQSPSRVSVPPKLEHSKNEKVAPSSLNPLAPKFIPGNSKQKVDYHQKECHGDSSPSFQKIAALAVTYSLREHKLIDSVKAGTCPSEKINDIGMQCSNDARDSGKECAVPYKSFTSSAVNSSCGFQPYLREECVTSENLLVRGTSVVGSKEGILDATQNGLDGVEDIAHNWPNTSFSFLASEIGLNSHSFGVGVFSDFTERPQETSRSRDLIIDVKLMINTIQYLLEMLLQNSSFDLGSLSEHEHDKLLNIINNLSVIRNKAGQMTVKPDSSNPCTLYGQTEAADHHEHQILIFR
ncbi:uncharacterized protein LOC111308207 isoform X2 [Durio zibethinus]|uniref:Uncharacterized protein LOC111308207 isoform X2 n=1 Tax=Durio zibethinus TaxID=66656 RepID=A0A6P6ABV8_DURZI|nr:uncharacterized protein LOC111308207 isoform X2 [Durio zibethinus]